MSLGAYARAAETLRFGPVEPFLAPGAGYGYVMARADPAPFSSPGASGDLLDYHTALFDLGGGLDLWLGRRAALSLRVLYRGAYTRMIQSAQWPYLPVDPSGDYLHGLALDLAAAFHF